MSTPEGLLKTKIRKMLTNKGIFWSSIQGGPGSKPGDPDLIICLNGRFVGLEVKSQSGRQSPIQKVRQEQIVNSGGEYHIIRTLREVEELIGEKNEGNISE